MASVQELQAFNIAYTNYITNKCTLTSTTEPCKPIVTTLNSEYGKVNAINDDAPYTTFMDTYNANKKLQDELRAKMKELNKTPDSLYAEHQSAYDSAIYMNIIATVLATSLLYFVFVKLE